MRRNLISVSVLDKAGYFFDIRNFILKLFFDSNLVGTGFLSDGLYRLKLNTNKDFTSLHVESSGTKRALIKENSSTIWHKRLGHISKEIIERLMKDDALPNLDFNDFETCVDCVRGKFTKTKRKGSTRSKDLLEIIHTDIYIYIYFFFLM